ncbi:MAG: 30S ribosome-binding factor RbfA [Pseudomonadota bacterium]
MDRVSDVLRRIVSETISSRVHHRGLEGVTVTDVTVTADIRHAKVYYRVLDPSTRVEVARALKKSAYLFQRQLNQELQTRYIPHLTFEYDETLERGMHIESLLKSVRKNEEE